MEEKLIPPHGGYRKLKSYRATTLIYDLTASFCRNYVTEDRRLRDQMVHAARSGRQNIAEGCQASGTSKKTEIKLVGVARASLEELLIDYEDYLRQHGYEQWTKEDDRALEVRAIAFWEDRSDRSYTTYLLDPGMAANALICLIHQANYLLDRQLRALEEAFLKEGGFTERLYKQRRSFRRDTSG